MDDDHNIINIKGPDKFTNFLKKLNLLGIVLMALLFLFVITAPTMFFQVETEEDAVVLRFGKYNRTVGPGLHFKLPFNLEETFRVPVRRVLKMEFGFRTTSPGVRTKKRTRGYGDESIMLTGDLNVVDVKWIIQFKIKNARDFLFNVRNVPNNLYDISEAVMREVVGDHTATEAINVARDEIALKAKDMMQAILDEYDMGIHLVALELQEIYPPDKVKPSFDEVNAAVQEANQIANAAEQKRRKLVQEEKGKALQQIKNAEAYKVNLVNRAKGDANRFLALYNEYKKAPEVTKQRLYFDQVQKILSKTDKVYIVDPDVKGIVPFLKLGGGAP